VHVFFGYNYYAGEQLFWYENFTNSLLEIILPYQHNHVLSIGAHIHHINVMAAASSAVPDIAIVQVICPSVTPVYNNNPGFGLLTIDSNGDIEFVFTFLQLEDYHRYGVFNYEDYEPAAEGGFDLTDPASIR
jgi:hypothetical protein